MDCEEIIKLISGYMDGEIDILLRDELEQHLYECERCLAILHTVEKTIVFSREIHRRRKVPEQVINKVCYEIRIRYRK